MMASPILRNIVSAQLIFLCLAAGRFVICDGQTAPPQKRDVEVLRVNIELVQSPVMVFDKQGHFVDGLQREQFELKVDGRPRAISFFDRVTAGTPSEALKLEAARGTMPIDARTTASKASVYGRTLLFFVDDLHLAADSINRTRAALLKFIDESMGQNDRALITTTSGQLGFLQQLTDNKDVLRAAAERLRPRQFLPQDDERPPMGPYQALSIETNDSNVLKYYVELYFADYTQNMNKQPPDTPDPKDRAAAAQMRGETARRLAEIHVRARARNILNQYTEITKSSFASLRYLMASSAELPGRKLIFVISDGFYLNRGVAGESQKLGEITSAALRAGAVIYSIQASGLGSVFPDAKADLRQGHNMPMELPRAGSDQALQAPLYTLAVDTGGRALFNSNSMDGSIRQALKETSEYYLLAWRPESAEQHSESFSQIQVTIKNHPEFNLRLQKGYLSPAKSAATEVAARPAPSEQVNKAPAAEEKIRGVLSAPYPVLDLPTSVNVSFLDQPTEGEQIMVASEISTEAAGSTGPFDLVGVVLNNEGKSVWTFRERLTHDSESAKSVSQITQIKIKPGLYQVRVAARDQQSGVAGSAAQWILVPDLSTRRIALSSLLIGDRAQEAAGSSKTASEQRVPLSISRRFTRDSRLRFMTFIYNAAPGQGAKASPDVTIQMRLMRDDKAVFTGPLVKVGTEGQNDLARLPYAAELSLRTLPSGRYALLVTATDAATKARATQGIKFQID